jgi:methylenetetrahydrofolate--tRNA-(uracil-5-)-methyltransferase
LDQKLQDKTFSPPPRESALGSLMEAITDPTRAEHFQPTNINFALFPPLAERERDKETRKKKQIALARASFEAWIAKK